MSCCKTYDPCLDGKLNQIGSYAAAARTSAQNSAASATQSANSATASAASSTNSATSATNSQNSANDSADSASEANNYLTQVENIFEDFDERYLGSKAVAPTVDNQGNPLQEGALYWNSVSDQMFAWNGTIWVATNFNQLTNFTATGTTTARNLVTRFADVVNVKDFGAVGNGVADDTAAIQACCNAGGVFRIPYGVIIRLTSAITVSQPVSFIGSGCVAYKDLDETSNNVRGEGSWFYIDHVGKGFVVDGTSGANDSIAVIRFEKCGAFRNQPTPTAGAFTPLNCDWDFDVADAEFQMDDFVALNPTKFLKATLPRGGRLRLKNVRGQPLQRGIEIDQCYDICLLECHFWPYWSLNASVKTYTLANLTSLITGRVDGLLLQRFFTIWANIGWNIVNNSFGTVNRAHADWLYLDNLTRGIVVNASASGATVNINELTAFGVSTSSSYGMEVACDNFSATIGYADFENFYNQAIYIVGTGNRIQMSNPKFKNYSLSAIGPAIVNGAGNTVLFNGAVNHSPASGRFLISGSGTFNSIDQWIPYSPVVASSTGTITTVGTVSASYRLHGNVVDVQFSIGITTNGTGSGFLKVSLPIAPSGFGVGAARETVTSGNMCVVQVVPSNADATVLTYNNNYPVASGSTIVGSVSYRR